MIECVVRPGRKLGDLGDVGDLGELSPSYSSPSFRVGPICITRKLGDVWKSFRNFSKLSVSHCLRVDLMQLQSILIQEKSWHSSKDGQQPMLLGCLFLFTFTRSRFVFSMHWFRTLGSLMSRLFD